MLTDANYIFIYIEVMIIIATQRRLRSSIASVKANQMRIERLITPLLRDNLPDKLNYLGGVDYRGLGFGFIQLSSHELFHCSRL